MSNLGKIIAWILIFSIVVFIFCVPAFASGGGGRPQPTPEGVLKQRASFSQWVGGAFQRVYGYSAGLACPNSEDNFHYANDYLSWSKDENGAIIYTCQCAGCGATFTAYESDLKQSYDDQVAELPATGITSAGRLIWQTSLGDMGRYFNVVCGPTVYYEASITSFPWHGSSGYLSEVGFDVASSGSALSFSYSGNPWLTFVGFKCAYFIAPFAGSYRLLGDRLASGSYLLESGVIGTIDGDYSADSSFKHYSASEEFSLSDAYVFWDGAVSFASGYVYLPAFEVIPDTAIDTTSGGQYNINTRPTSITGGNYGIIGDDGEITTITNNNQIINETNNTYYNPATGESKPIVDWSYDYGDRTYNVTLEGGDTVQVTYGDEQITINQGDTVYNIYYIIDGSGSGDNPSPAPTACPHEWYKTGERQATCLVPAQRTYTCSICGEQKTETDPVLGHSWHVIQTVTTQYDENGNMTQEGYTIYECERCGEQYKSTNNTGPPPPGGGGSGGSSGNNIFSGIFGLIWDFFTFLFDLFSEFVVGGIKGFISGLKDAGSSFFSILNPFEWGY